MTRYQIDKQPQSLAELEPMINAALSELSELCHGKRFRMCVPVDDADSDIVIGDALRHSLAFVKAALSRVATQVSPPTPKIASDRKGLLYLASRFADLARGVDEPDPEPDDEHDPETCDVCAKIADELTVLITNELRYAEALSSPPPEPGERT